MAIREVLILGAGPCGMSTAIALAKLPSEPDNPPLRITLVEVRPKLSTIGGTINLTPLAMRYLDYLGVGSRLRQNSISLDDGLDYLSLRTGQRLGNIWGGVGARRAARHDLVSSLLETIKESHSNSIDIQWGRRLAEISEADDKVVVRFEGSDEPVRFDIMIGADGIHSQARHLFVEPSRQKTFSGRICVMGWNEEAHQKNESGGVQSSGKAEPPLKLASGEPALRDTVVINGFNGILLGSYYEPSRSKVYLVHIALMDEPKDGNARDGWNVVGNDKIAIRDNVCDAYRGGKIGGIEQLVENCQDWHLWPVYILPGQGRWYRGRVLLLGDASHAVSYLNYQAIRVVLTSVLDGSAGGEYWIRD